jgi:3-hydroxybutyryl-CoA dehydratase
MKDYKFSEIKVGLVESFNTKVELSMMNDFLSISKDINPLHTDSDYAKEKGFFDRVAYGMLTSTFYSTLVGVYLPGKYCLLQGIDIQFSKPVYINDQLEISGTVSYINEAYKQVEIKAKIVNQKKIRVSKATIRVGMIDE